MKKYTISFSLLSVLLPFLSFAQPLGGVKSLVSSFGEIVNKIIPVMFGIALLYFFWGLGQFILHSDEEEALKNGKKKMLWGVIALFVFVSIFGILKYIGDSVGIGPGGLIDSNGLMNVTDTGGGKDCTPTGVEQGLCY